MVSRVGSKVNFSGCDYRLTALFACCVAWGGGSIHLPMTLSSSLRKRGILLSITHAACVISPFSPAQLLSTLWTVALQAPLSMGFSRQEHWSGLPCPPPGDLPDPGVKPTSLTSPALAGGFFTISATWEALLHSVCYTKQLNSSCCCLSKLWTKSVLSPLLLV